jgi:hypothetical protein
LDNIVTGSAIIGSYSISKTKISLSFGSVTAEKFIGDDISCTALKFEAIVPDVIIEGI